jgi:hypothetical protein
MDVILAVSKAASVPSHIAHYETAATNIHTKCASIRDDYSWMSFQKFRQFDNQGSCCNSKESSGLQVWVGRIGHCTFVLGVVELRISEAKCHPVPHR